MICKRSKTKVSTTEKVSYGVNAQWWGVARGCASYSTKLVAVCLTEKLSDFFMMPNTTIFLKKGQ